MWHCRCRLHRCLRPLICTAPLLPSTPIRLHSSLLSNSPTLLPLLSPLALHTTTMSTRGSYTTAESWLAGRVGEVPATSVGWFRAGVGFYNKREFQFSIECLQRSVMMDPLNVRIGETRDTVGPRGSSRDRAELTRRALVRCALLLQYNAFQIMARACIAVNRTCHATHWHAPRLSRLSILISLVSRARSAACSRVCQAATMPSKP